MSALVTFLLILAIIVGIEWYLIVCISLMANNVENLFMCLLIICICSFEKYLFASFDHFLTELSFYWRVIRALHTFCIQLSYQIHDLRISLPILWTAFYFVDSILWCKKHFNFDQVQIFFRCLYFLVLYLRNHWLTQGHKDLLFSSKYSIVLALRSILS